MSKVNISLVGGQPMPVYVGIYATNCDHVILIHSEGEKGSQPEAEGIKSGCGLPATLYALPTADYYDILVKAEELLSDMSDEEVWVNISGGTKLWTVAFTMLSFGRKNITVFYIDQNNVFHNITQKSCRDLCLNLDIETILRYNNQPLPTYTSYTDYTKEDHEVLKKVIRLRNYAFKDFNTLTIPLKRSDWCRDLESMAMPQLTLTSDSSILYEKALKTITITLKKRGSMMIEQLRSEHVGNIVFHAGWMEFFVAKTLSKWPMSKEIWLNVKFPYRDGKAKNEIDVIVNVGEKLLFVECKTQITDNTDIDKFRTAVRNYSGMGSKAVFVTYSPMRPEALQKCKDSGILTFSFQKEPYLMRPESELLNMLDKEITNINKK